MRRTLASDAPKWLYATSVTNVPAGTNSSDGFGGSQINSASARTPVSVELIATSSMLTAAPS